MLDNLYNNGKKLERHIYTKDKSGKKIEIPDFKEFLLQNYREVILSMEVEPWANEFKDMIHG